jgi:hypothetical protein
LGLESEIRKKEEEYAIEYENKVKVKDNRMREME